MSWLHIIWSWLLRCRIGCPRQAVELVLGASLESMLADLLDPATGRLRAQLDPVLLEDIDLAMTRVHRLMDSLLVIEVRALLGRDIRVIPSAFLKPSQGAPDPARLLLRVRAALARFGRLADAARKLAAQGSTQMVLGAAWPDPAGAAQLEADTFGDLSRTPGPGMKAALPAARLARGPPWRSFGPPVILQA